MCAVDVFLTSRSRRAPEVAGVGTATVLAERPTRKNKCTDVGKLEDERHNGEVQSSCRMTISKEKQKLELPWNNNDAGFQFAKMSYMTDASRIELNKLYKQTFFSQDLILQSKTGS